MPPLLLLLLLLALLPLPSSPARAVPSAAQLAWVGKFGAIFHYEMATYSLQTGHGCGYGSWNGSSNNPRTFSPPQCPDTDQWLDAVVSAGMDYAVLVAKHNCGFLTWPTLTTLPSGAPYGYDIGHSGAPPGCNVVASFLASCERAGVRPGLYYSFGTNVYLDVQGGAVQNRTLLPGMAAVTQAQFRDLALAQIEELWGGRAAGRLFEIWADGGVPLDPLFRAALAEKKGRLQPQATFYNGAPVFNTTAVRWIGSEDGFVRFQRPQPPARKTLTPNPPKQAPDPNWSTGSCLMGAPAHGPLPPGGDPDSPFFCPAEVDSTLQADDAWFWVENAALNPLPALRASYHASLGRNANWLLGLSPNRDGLLPAEHVAAAGALGAWVRGCYGAPLAVGSAAPGATSVTVPLGAAGGAVVDRVRLVEGLARGQVVRRYNVSAAVAGAKRRYSNGTSVGAGKIDVLSGAVAGVTEVVVDVDTAPTALRVEVFAPCP
jgi:alpha-L-fucosidase